MERVRWTDERLDDRKAAVDHALDELRTDVRALAPIGAQVAGVEATLGGIAEDVHDALAAARDACRKADEATAAANKGRKDTLIALLGFAAPVAVALIGGVVALILGVGGGH